VSYACYVAANWPFARSASDAPPVLDPDLRRQVDAFVVYATLGSLAGAGLAQLSMVIAKSATSATDAGHFAAALSLAAPAGLLANAVILVTSPALADLLGRGEHGLARVQTDQGTRSLAVSMFAVFGAVILASNPLLRLFYGAGFDDAVPILRVLLVAVLLPSLAAAATSSLLVRHGDGQKVFAWCNIVGLVVGLVTTAVLLGMHHHDVVVVAWGYLVGAAVVGLAPLGIVWRRERHRWLGLALRVSAGGIVVLGLRLAETGLGLPVWWDLAPAVGFAIVWLAVGRRDISGLRRSALAAGDAQ
jgi:O-antigen/teichoic acid export membrane protein